MISPYKSAFYLMGIPLLFYAAAWRTAFFRAADELARPSLQHIYALVSTRSFLVLVIIYLAAVCVFYGDRVRKRDDSIDSLRRDRQMLVDEYSRLRDRADAERPNQTLQPTAGRSDD